jgi:hypothetical protein
VPESGSLAQTIGGAVGVAAVATAFVAATWRYAAVLRGYSDRGVELRTAIGFFLGLGFSAALVILDQIGA